ncbi:TonB-dependent receptor [Sphingomonas solaris]|uniref:TonB-dependent receptor n=1 Tax=Alterirhizorhabdus solaris TaxID=2529389 RepID=A0A558RCT7_9SPHN|nr:TonB-dependent receptor [Sphingomonas solaris]TVV77259.1 TonB-dependent receptor [Sphingomonas solaris]
MIRRRTIAAGAVPVALIVAATGPAIAQDAGEIVVTAQRRVERLRDVPAAVTVVSGATMEAADLSDAKAIIRFTPGFSGAADNNFVDGIAIRGIASNDYGIGGDPSIGVFRDGIHLGRTGTAITTSYDLARIEALRGPQVFLFGRNAISGALAIVTVAPDPDRAGGYASARLGTRDRHEVQGAYNVPLGDGWAFRLAADRETEDGSTRNVALPDARRLGWRNVAAVRASLLHRGETTTVRLTGEYEHRRLSGAAHRAQDDTEVFATLASVAPDLAIGGGRRDVDSDVRAPVDATRVGSLTLRIDHVAGDWTFASLTGVRAHRYRYLEDYDGTPLTIDTYGVRQRGDYASQEFTAVSSGGPVTWSFGVSAYRERIRSVHTNAIAETIVCGPAWGYTDCDALTADFYGTPYVPSPDGTLTDINRARGANRGVSAYGAADWQATPTLTLGAGARWTRDRKRFDLDVPPVASSLGNIFLSTYHTDGYVRAARTWDGLSPRLTLRWQPSRAWTLYASATRGTKAGGSGTFSLPGPGALDDYGPAPAGTRPDDYGEEKVRSIEAGAKGRLPAGLGTAALTVFHYIYDDLQANVFDPVTHSTQVVNIGRVYGSGVEAEATLTLGRHVDLTIEGAYIHTRKTRDRECTARDCGGLGNPALSGGAILRVHAPFRGGEAYAQGEASYAGRARRSFDDRGFGRVPACGRADMRAGYAADAGWTVEGYLRNVTDAICYAGADNGGGTSPATRWAPILARSAGMTVTRRF